MIQDREPQDTPTVQTLDPTRLYRAYLYINGSVRMTVFRPGLIQGGLVRLHVIFPKEEAHACTVSRIKEFVPVDPVWLGLLYTGVMRVITEYRASVGAEES